MYQSYCRVQEVREAAPGIHVLRFESKDVARSVQPGQFVNIKADGGNDPLLRRPFSVYRTEGDSVEIVFNIIGKGTDALRRKLGGERIDVLGPLGNPFSFLTSSFDTAVLVGGGLGVAPLPISTDLLARSGKKIITILGARTSMQLVEEYLENLNVATDDGTKGFHGNVVDLFRDLRTRTKISNPKLFCCGPTPMLRAIASYAIKEEIPCEVSMEGPMACGFGICQGCPVELVGEERKYALMCKEGPSFDVRRIRF